jgi:hypothetical protein
LGYAPTTVVVDPSNRTTTAPARTDSNDGNGNGTSYIGCSTSILNQIKRLEEKVDDLQGLEKFLKEVEGKTDEVDEDSKYPRDCYSFIALNGPEKNGLWSEKKSFFVFLFGLMVVAFQLIFISLLLWGEIAVETGTVGYSENPGSDFWASFMPPNAQNIV